MCHIVTIAGSPSQNAKSTALLDHAQRLLRRRGVHTHSIVVRDLSANDLLHDRLDSEAIQAANLLLDQAEGIIIVTPLCKAVYAGALKAFLEGLPQHALAGKTVLLLEAEGSPSLLSAREHALKPVLSALGATHILRGVRAGDAQVEFDHGGLLRLDCDMEQRLSAGLEALIGDSHPQGKGKRPALAATAITV